MGKGGGGTNQPAMLGMLFLNGGSKLLFGDIGLEDVFSVLMRSEMNWDVEEGEGGEVYIPGVLLFSSPIK